MSKEARADGTREGKNGGTLAPIWQKGQSGNPGGLLKDFVPLSRAYAILATLKHETIRELADTGIFPPKWQYPQCFTFVVAARAWSELKDRPIPGLLSELADRTEGKVPQRVQAELDIRGVIVVPASQLSSGNWSQSVLDAEVIDAKALMPADEDDDAA